jgi:hypothetical protein
MKTFHVLSLGLAAGLQVAACSSSTSSSGGASLPTAPASQTFESMSASEAQTYCTQLDAYTSSRISPDETKRATCTFAAAFSTIGATSDADAQAKCKAAYDECLATPAEPSSGDPCANFAAKAASCKGSGLTVGEYNACVDEQVGFIKALAGANACSEVKAGDSPSTDPPTDKPPSKCDVVDTKCPGLNRDG